MIKNQVFFIVYFFFLSNFAYSHSSSDKTSHGINFNFEDLYESAYQDCMIKFVKPSLTNAHRKTVQDYCHNKVYHKK